MVYDVLSNADLVMKGCCACFDDSPKLESPHPRDDICQQLLKLGFCMALVPAGIPHDFLSDFWPSFRPTFGLIFGSTFGPTFVLTFGPTLSPTWLASRFISPVIREGIVSWATACPI